LQELHHPIPLPHRLKGILQNDLHFFFLHLLVIL